MSAYEVGGMCTSSPPGLSTDAVRLVGGLNIADVQVEQECQNM